MLDGRPFDRALARINGLRDADVTGLAAAGVVRQVVRGVYLDARVPDDLASRAACLRLRLPAGAVVARLTAAWLLGVDGRMPEAMAAPPVVECVVPPGSQPLRRPGIRCYVAALGDEVCEIGGIPTTTPLRTALDCLRWLRPHMALGVADALAASSFVTPDQLLVRVAEAAGMRGVVQARRLAGTRRATDGVHGRVVAQAPDRRRRVPPSNGADRGSGRRRPVCVPTRPGMGRREARGRVRRRGPPFDAGAAWARPAPARGPRADVRVADPRGGQGRGARLFAGARAGARRAPQPRAAASDVAHGDVSSHDQRGLHDQRRF